MNSKLARVMIRLYPRAWQHRYGDEFEALLESNPGSLAQIANVALFALHERIFPTQGGKMDRNPDSFGAVVRHPSALIPIAMSLTALALVLGHIAIYGPAREADEGAVAHLWQILMAAQLPVLPLFAVKWLRRAPKQALGVLALQAGAVLSAMAPVLYFNL
jgi:hypothetical protein